MANARYRTGIDRLETVTQPLAYRPTAHCLGVTAPR
jgi:hypothetical protein